MCDCDIKKLVDDAIAWAREAGEVQLKYQTTFSLHYLKKFVTKSQETDSEKFF